MTDKADVQDSLDALVAYHCDRFAGSLMYDVPLTELTREELMATVCYLHDVNTECQQQHMTSLEILLTP